MTLILRNLTKSQDIQKAPEALGEASRVLEFVMFVVAG